jgi:hypothetical protein
MSNALAIGAVTAVIQNLLENGLIRQGISGQLGGRPTVTVLSPNPESNNNGGGQNLDDRLNLFLYQTALNSGWQNVGLPSRNSSGDRVSNPPLAIDLHYLLTAYSQEAFHAEILLGYGMQVLHETPVLTRDAIRTALRNLVASTNNPTSAQRTLSTADLAEQVEQIKISLHQMSTEEMFRVWSAIQTQYRPTTAYHVSVVLIETQRSTKSALPVRDRQLLAIPFQQPTITAVLPQVVTPGSQLTLQGQSLKSHPVFVTFGAGNIAPDAVRDSEIQVTIPDNLSAGINTVQVVQIVQTGEAPASERKSAASNLMPFVLRPKILGDIVPIQLAAGKADLTLSVDPVIRDTQRVTVFLNERSSGTSYSAIAPKREEDTTSIVVPISGIRAGNYLVRLQVDGAESLLEADADPNSLTFNQYNQPQVAIACASNCLRSTIALTSTTATPVFNIEGRVTVRSETEDAVSNVSVSIVWTLPDGSTRRETNTTDTAGNATFNILGRPGTYQLSISNLSKSSFSFDPPQSVDVTKQITVTP